MLVVAKVPLVKVISGETSWISADVELVSVLEDTVELSNEELHHLLDILLEANTDD